MRNLLLVLLCGLSGVLATPVARYTSEDHQSLTSTSPRQASPWPLPQQYNVTAKAYAVDADHFLFLASRESCVILENAFTRYLQLTFGSRRGEKESPSTGARSSRDSIGKLVVEVEKNCVNAVPVLDSVESYTLTVQDGKALLKAPEVWGALRGLETFSQIVYQLSNGGFFVNDTAIVDFPRFQHRGVLLDTSNHFLSVASIKMNLDAMAMNKMNVFHWHLVDDASFPYQSSTFPQLSDKGAYDPETHVYTTADIIDVIEYARNRGIRVIPEFDSPGHTASWGLGQPDLLTACYNNQSQPDGTYGPINPASPRTYALLQKLLSEVSHTFFHSDFVHLGGNEVSFDCWASNPQIKQFMHKMGFGKNYTKLEQYYFENIIKFLHKENKSAIVWQEVIDNGAVLPKDTQVEVWKSHWSGTLSRVTELGHKALLASCWLLNEYSYGEDWPKFYTCDPQDFAGTEKQKALVLGGEAVMWGERVDDTNLITRLWPRASAAAERLWSSASVINVDAAYYRIRQMRCRMVARGLQAEVVDGPSFCVKEFYPYNDN